MVFEDRVAKYPGRWTMVKSDGSSEVVTLVRNDEPIVEGTPMNAETLNTLSDIAGADIARIAAETAALNAKQSEANAKYSEQEATRQAENSALSASAASISESNAKKYSEEAGAKANTDKTLSIENAPADSKAVGDAIKNIKIMAGASQDASGDSGLVPAPSAGDQERFLRGDGTWANIPEYSLATSTENGLMSAPDKAKLDNLYPVGSIYQSTDHTSPASLFGGTWEQVASERVLMGASSAHAAGTTAKAGLPNITGTLSNVMGPNTYAQSGSGALSSVKGSYALQEGSSGFRYNISFDASKSNAIYGRSNTVQPAAYYVHIWHRVA